MARAHTTPSGKTTSRLGAKHVRLQLRMPGLLHARLVLLAHSEGFTLNAYMVKLLDLSVANAVQPSLFPKESTDEPSR